MTINPVILLMMLCLPTIVQANWPFVYSGEHFYDLLGTPMDPFKAERSGILIMYKEECENNIGTIEYNLDRHIIFLIYDYGRAKDHTWYQFRPEDDLYEVYGSPEQCLSAFYFKKGSNLHQPTAVWSGKGTISEWVWGLLKRQIAIFNECKEDLIIEQSSTTFPGPDVPPKQVILSGRMIQITTYVSYLVTIGDTHWLDIYYANVVTEDQELEIHLQTPLDDVKPSKMKEDENEELEFLRGWVWTHADRHLRNIKQPLLVHNFTEIGYQKSKIPEGLYRELKTFYDTNKKDRYTETTLAKVDSIIRSQSQFKKPTLVPLPQHLTELMVSSIQPILEEWCQTKLKMTHVYGIREYYKGNILHHHVDRVNTHVIAVILQIEQDLGGAEDWMLEVIQYSGERKDVKLLPGEMLLYEASKLIHGRPRAFRGKLFANAFMHFAPIEGWGYEFNVEDKHWFNQNSDTREGLVNVYSDLTKEKNMFRKKDEL